MLQKTISKLLKKILAGFTSLAILFSLIPTNIPTAQAATDIVVTYNLPAVQGLNDTQFHHNILFGGGIVASGNGNSTHSNLPEINGYTLEVDILPAGYVVGNNPHPIPIDLTSGAANITINIVQDVNNPPPPQTGSVNVTYNLPAVQGLTDNQFHHNLETVNPVTIIGSGNGNGSIDNLTAANYQLNVDILPAGYLVNNNPHPIPVTVTAGQTTNIVVDIIVDPNNPPPGNSGSVNITYNIPAVQGLTDSQFHHNLETLNPVTVVGSGNGNGTINNITAGNYQLNVDILPVGFIVGNNPHPIPVTVTAGQTTNIVVDILVDPNNPGGSGTVTVTYNLPAIQGLTDSQFHANLETINPVTVVASGNGNSVFNNIPAGNFQLNVDILPTGLIVGNNPHPIPVAVLAGQNTTVVVDILLDPNINGGVPGQVNVIYNLPQGSGLNDTQFHHNVLTTPQGLIIAGGNGNGLISNLPAQNYTLDVDIIPAGFRVSNFPHPIPFTVLPGNTTTVVVNIVPNGAQTVGHLAVAFTAPIGIDASTVEHTLTGPNNFSQTQTGNVVYSNLQPGAYTLTVNQATLPAGTQIQGGTNVFNVNIVADQTATLNIVLEAIQAPNAGDIAVQFTVPNGFNAATVEHTLVRDSDSQTINTLLGNAVYNAVNPEAHTLTVNQATLPAGLQIQGGTNVFQATAIAGQTVTITIVLEPVQNPNTGNIAVQFNVPQGVNPATIQHTLVRDSDSQTINTLLGNAVYNALNPEAHTLTVNQATIPAGFQLAGGTNTFQATVIAGQTVTITITLVPLGQNGNVVVQFNAPNGVNVAVIEHTLNQDNGAFTNTLLGNATYNAVPVDTYTLTVNAATIPNGFQTQGGILVFNTTVTAGQTSTITITIVPVNNAAIIVNPTNNLQTTENGGQATFTVVLGTVPTDDVTITLQSSDLTEGVIDTPTITFTPANALQPRTVTITGVVDGIVDGNVFYTIITNPATSNDLNYANVDPADVQVVNIDVNNNGGGGGRRRRLGYPVIQFYVNNIEVTEISTTAGSTIDVKVVATDGRSALSFPQISLDLVTDPSAGTSSIAGFTTENQDTPQVDGRLVWTPNNDHQGSNEFVFRSTANGLNQVDQTLKISVAEGLASNNGIPGGGGGQVQDPDDIDFSRCFYNDNTTESVIFLCMLGIIDPPSSSFDFEGKNKGKNYFGGDLITRAAFTKIMVNITYEESTIERVGKLIIRNNFFAFPDVEPIAWFSKYIAAAKLEDHVHGYPGTGLFIPWNNIEVSESMKILFNTAGHDNAKVKDDLQEVRDQLEEGAPWFMAYAMLAYAYEGFTPSLDRDPGLIYSANLTRQQAADIIYRTIVNAGIEPKSKLSQLRQEVTRLKQQLAEQQTEETPLATAATI